MTSRDSVERLAFPFLVASVVTAAALPLAEIWLESASLFLLLRQRGRASAVVIALASWFLLAGARREARGAA